MTTKPPLIEIMYKGVTIIYGLLTCGHYTTFHEASSAWDFPAEAHECPDGCGERQFDLRLQLLLMDMQKVQRGPYDWATDDDDWTI